MAFFAAAGALLSEWRGLVVHRNTRGWVTLGSWCQGGGAWDGAPGRGGVDGAEGSCAGGGIPMWVLGMKMKSGELGGSCACCRERDSAVMAFSSPSGRCKRATHL